VYDRTTKPRKCLSSVASVLSNGQVPVESLALISVPGKSFDKCLFGRLKKIRLIVGIYNHVCFPVARSIGPVEPAIGAQQRSQKWPTRCTRGAHGSVSGDVFRARASYGIHHDAVLGAGWFLDFCLTLADVQCLIKNHVHLADPSCRSSSGPGVATV
jgi:hypothetical protein